MSSTVSDQRYFVPDSSLVTAPGIVALFLLGLGAAFTINHVSAGVWLLAAGTGFLLWMLFAWFGAVIRESESGLYSAVVDKSYRYGMVWFIFSEVMFFATFFGSLFFVRVWGIADFADPLQQSLWTGFNPTSWKTAGPYLPNDFHVMGAWGIPAINTAILLTSGLTLTWAHWGLLKNKRSQLILGLVLTVALGSVFLALQIYEYGHAYAELNLKFTTGIYGALFYMMTGFHGLHVLLGTIMLLVVLLRSIKGHFRADHHFAFEAAAWYWHFVDVVWLILFVFIYWI